MTWGCLITNGCVKWENSHSGSFSLEVDLILSADQGTKVPVMGRTGSGKSTLLSLMAGLKWPTTGEVLWVFPDQEKVQWSQAQLPSPQELVELRQNRFGFAFQNSTLLPHLNVQDNLTYPLELKGISTTEARSTVKETLNDMLLEQEQAEIDKLLQRFPHEISGGQYQRVALAQAVAHNPNVLFADEPTGNLDLETRRQVMRVLNKWLTKEGWKGKRMLVWVTHHNNDPQLYGAKKFLSVKHKNAHKARCEWEKTRVGLI
ncbi:ABC transporter ATP-binding protein yxdL [Candidatus Thiomargarita nelsonii]|uniref:ABC transporter ATP-binding protein yxdL n=1 Tax=Candidatus Thiomargarita nelsonii TaxID=1003181 RepID=A0A176S596_9GAMM|nr:ABC transporter ATP-binding protein yxdL [Candidatus Thiomargarita nelsonii]